MVTLGGNDTYNLTLSQVTGFKRALVLLACALLYFVPE